MDSLHVVATRVVRALQDEGHVLARVDSVAVGSDDGAPRVTVYATRGPAVPVTRIVLSGFHALDEPTVLRLMETRAGAPLRPEALEGDVDALLAAYERMGYPLAQLRVDDITVHRVPEPHLTLALTVDEGQAVSVSRVELVGAERTRPAFARRVAGLRTGHPLVSYDPSAIQRALDETALFDAVGAPQLVLESDTSAVVRIPVEDASPGSFDVVLGYLPAGGGRGRGSLVGNGHLELRNLFGQGRTFSLRLNRLPGQVSSVDVEASDPFVLGLPLQASARFHGLQQDSTYGQQRYGGEIAARLEGGLQAFASVSREVARPGQAGIALTMGGRQRVAASRILFLGLGARYRHVDRVVNPSRGLTIQTNLETGTRQRTERRVAAGDTTLQTTADRQRRLRLATRVYVPVARHQVIATGGEAAVLLSDRYDVSDLFRLGGATSLRGNDEDRFLGRIVARWLAEYRYQIDRQSYAFLFFDLGYVETPATADGGSLPAARGLHPGYGFGIQFSSAVGLINVSAGLNPEDGPADARIHVGLSFGL